MRQTISAADAAPQTTPVTVRAGSPAALLAIVPHLLGFVPEASLVVIGTAPPRDRVKVTLRYDLPDPPDTALAADIAAHAAGVIGSQQMTAAVAVGYGHEPLVTPLADALSDAFSQAGIDLREFLRVQDGRYWSYLCGDEACCPPAGVPFDPRTHPAAAALAPAGPRCLPTARPWPRALRRSAAPPRTPCDRPPAARSAMSPSYSARSASPPASASPGR